MRLFKQSILVGLIAIAVDFLLLHSPNPVASSFGYSIIPENSFYFMSKLVIVAISYVAVKKYYHRGGYKEASLIALVGTASFSMFYYLIRPIVFGLGMTLTIGVIHFLAIFLAVIASRYLIRRLNI